MRSIDRPNQSLHKYAVVVGEHKLDICELWWGLCVDPNETCIAYMIPHLL